MPQRSLTAADLIHLACPVCQAPLAVAHEAIRCTACDRLYPIVDGIPILLAARATAASAH